MNTRSKGRGKGKGKPFRRGKVVLSIAERKAAPEECLPRLQHRPELRQRPEQLAETANDNGVNPSSRPWVSRHPLDIQQTTLVHSPPRPWPSFQHNHAALPRSRGIRKVAATVGRMSRADCRGFSRSHDCAGLWGPTGSVQGKSRLWANSSPSAGFGLGIPALVTLFSHKSTIPAQDLLLVPLPDLPATSGKLSRGERAQLLRVSFRNAHIMSSATAAGASQTAVPQPQATTPQLYVAQLLKEVSMLPRHD